MKNLNLELREGRSESAAKLHSIAKFVRQDRAVRKRDVAIGSFNRATGEDYWSERGEHGRWVRMHTVPRRALFNPWQAPRGPGRKTRLHPSRTVRGVRSDRDEFIIKDNWMNVEGEKEQMPLPWTGQSIFIVDRLHSVDYGTDQRRQRTSVSNLKKVSWASSSNEQE